MSKRLEILKNSLLKKEEEFSNKLNNHFETVKLANGQPLNDKRNGYKTLHKWEKQNQSLHNVQASIAKTQVAIEREELKISVVASFEVPAPIQKLLDDGIVTQWRKFPNRFFIAGVDKARIIFEDGQLLHKFVKKIPTKEQYIIFRDVFNNLKQQLA